MTKGDAKQWLDSVIEAQENFVALRKFEGVELSTKEMEESVFVFRGFTELAEAIGEPIETYTHKYLDGEYWYASFDYRKYKICTCKRLEN